MTSGLEAYRLQMGRAVRGEDAVNIFDNGPDVNKKLDRAGLKSGHLHVDALGCPLLIILGSDPYFFSTSWAFPGLSSR
jgi:hypothetical protein